MSIPISGWWWTHQGYQYRGGSHSSPALLSLLSTTAVDKCPGPFMTSAETVCFSCTADSSHKREVAQCPGQLAMGTMEGYLQSGSLYFPGYRTGCAPDSDTSCVAREQQRMHSLGLERSLVKTLVPPSSQLDWCHAQEKDPLACYISVMLSFLQHLFDLGWAGYTIILFIRSVMLCHQEHIPWQHNS